MKNTFKEEEEEGSFEYRNQALKRRYVTRNQFEKAKEEIKQEAYNCGYDFK